MPRFKANVADAALPPSIQQDQDKRTAMLIADFRDAFRTAPGQRVLAHLLNYTGLCRDGWDADPNRHAYNAGVRAVGIHILDQVTKDPEAIKAMLTEGEVEGLFRP